MNPRGSRISRSYSCGSTAAASGTGRGSTSRSITNPAAKISSQVLSNGALTALAQLRAAAIRGALTGSIALPAASSACGHDGGATGGDAQVSDADLQIPLGDAPVPARGGQPCPPGIAPIRLSIAETARLASLAAHYTAGLITRARLAFALRWSARRRRHQATARWHTTAPGSLP